MSLEVRPRKVPSGQTVYYLTGTYLKQRVRLSLGTDNEREAKKIAARALPGLMQQIKDGQYISDNFNAAADYYVSKGGDARFLPPLREKFGRRHMNSITDAEVEEFAIEYGDERDWTNQTRNRQILTPFQAVCNAGAKRRPPLCAHRLFIRFSTEKPAVIDAPEWWIQWAIKTCVDEGQHDMARLIMFMTTTAVRISEALRVVWTDVDLDHAIIHIRKTKNSSSRRTVLIPELVRQFRAATDHLQKVFPFATKDVVTKRITAMCKRHGQPYYSTHQFGRHAFARRLLVDKGASLLMVKEAGGWRSLQVVVDNYGHLEHTHTEQLVRDVGEAFSSDYLAATQAQLLGETSIKTVT